MNPFHLFDGQTLFERMLSFGQVNGYALHVMEHAIVYDSYFQQIELGDSPFFDPDTKALAAFPEAKVGIDDTPILPECAYAAESYLRIQARTGLTFEAIFLYLPLEEMYRLYPLYHEMDFIQMENLFLERYEKESVLSLLLRERGYSLKEVAEITGIPYATLSSWKLRRRDIRLGKVEALMALARLFHVRLESVAEIKVNPHTHG